MRATWAAVRRAFERHIKHYLPQRGEPAVIGLRAEGSVSLQYAGRVVLELFQNALDRAEPPGTAGLSVLVQMRRDTLIVANNGRPFGVDPRFGYDDPPEAEGRADFNALCALHTSNKLADQQFGNKGIGFRSVFGVADRVQVWSRLRRGGWWGLELRSRFQPAAWPPNSPIPKLDERVRAAGTRPRPSFHFPVPLCSETAPAEGLDGMETVVLVPVHKNHRAQIKKELAALGTSHLRFVGLRKPGLVVRAGSRTLETTPTGVRSATHAQLAVAAESAGHPVKEPTVALIWTPDGKEGRFYNYLPTRMSTGLPVDIHGDFLVKADREGMSLDRDNDVGRYNCLLMESAAELLVEGLSADASHPDLWRRAGWPASGPPAWRAAMRRALVPDRSWATWLALANVFFKNKRKQSQIETFWNASERWLVEVVGYSHRSQSWASEARMICDHLAAKKLQTIPVETASGYINVALPSRQESGQRAERRVFYAEADKVRALPAALVAAGRAVTTFSLGPFEGPAGVSRYEAAELLRDLRQVPLQAKRFRPGKRLSVDAQEELLRFAAQLLPSDPPPHGFAWRAFSENEQRRRMGRALSTLFLPTLDARWEPARQLSMDRINTSLWPGLLDGSLCLWLGVAPAGGLPLVERGAAVPAQRHPPSLQPPGTARAGELAPLRGVSLSLMAVATTVEALPKEHRGSICAKLGASVWYPANLLRVAKGVPAMRRRVAPRDLVLAHRDNRTVFFPVPASRDHDELLTLLGAHTQLHGPRSSELLRSLHARVPVPCQLEERLQLRLAALAGGLLEGVDPESDAEPPSLLVRDQDGVRWRASGETAWLVPARDTNPVRRFFPTVPLVVGADRSGLSSYLGVGRARLALAARATGRPRATQLARQIKGRIEPLLGPLCAMAELSGQWVHSDEEEQDRPTSIRSRWFRTRVFLLPPISNEAKPPFRSHVC